MQIALIVPCYIDMFYPHVGIATFELLEKLGVDVVYPKDQTCCGQPMANSGCYEETRATEEHCARVFGSFDCVVTPSGSCTHHIRNKFTAGADSPEIQNLVRNTYDHTFEIRKYSELPFASTLNGSCTNVCPVKIDIHEQIYRWREVMEENDQIQVVKKGHAGGRQSAQPSCALPDRDNHTVNRTGRASHFAIYNRLNAWGKHRDVPEATTEAFHEWYRKHRLKTDEVEQ
jgi:Fe-S oxidoreductase